MKVEKIKFGIIFLPLSPLIMLIYVHIRWTMLGLIGFKKLWSQTSLFIVVSAFGIMALFFPILLCLLQSEWTPLIITLIILCIYVSHLSASLVIREIEYHQLLKTMK